MSKVVVLLLGWFYNAVNKHLYSVSLYNTLHVVFVKRNRETV